MSLTDTRASEERTRKPSVNLDLSYQAYLIERALMFDAGHPDRRQLVREYLDLTEPVEIDDVF